MADEGYFRLWNPQWCNSTTDKCIRTNVHGKRKMTFEIAVSEAGSAVAELGTAADAVLDGTTTPVLIYLDSSSAVDKDADTGAVRAVHVIGITVASAYDYIQGIEKPVYSVEEVRCDATAGTTAVATTRYYLRVMHMYATEWGTGGISSHDAEGNITLDSTGSAGTVYITIDAASNESNSSGLIYLVDGFYGRWNRCFISLQDVAVNVA